MREALKEARKAFTKGEIPVGAVIVIGNEIIARAHNTREASGDPLDHAEMRAIRRAAKKTGDWRLNACRLYVTLEPCPMCLGALFQARVGGLVFGACDEKRRGFTAGASAFPSLRDRLDAGGRAALSINNHNLKITGGVRDLEAAGLLKEFFRRHLDPSCRNLRAGPRSETKAPKTRAPSSAWRTP